MVKNVIFLKPHNSAKIRDQKVQFLSNGINRLKSEGKSVSDNRPSVHQHRGSPEGVRGSTALSYSTWLLDLTTFSFCCKYTARVCWHVHIPFATKIIQCYKSWPTGTAWIAVMPLGAEGYNSGKCCGRHLSSVKRPPATANRRLQDHFPDVCHCCIKSNLPDN